MRICSAIVSVSLIGLVTSAHAADLEPTVTRSWQCGLLNQHLPARLFVPHKDAPGAGRGGKRSAIIYLTGLPQPRIGKEPDNAIIADFVKQGFLVLTIDFGKEPNIVAPQINADLRNLRYHVERNPKLFRPHVVDLDRVYILPEGYRLERGVVFWDQGGTWRMDVRYPSQAVRPVPVLIQNPVDNAHRMNNKNIWQWNDMIAECGLTRGYAAVQIDNPVKRYQGVDPMPDVAVRLKAAIRTLRANAENWNLDAKHVALMGFSRGSGQAGVAALSDGIKRFEKGPHLDQSSRVQAVVLHAGRMDHLGLLEHCEQMAKFYRWKLGDPKKNRERWEACSAITYVTKDDPPTFLCVGSDDWYRTEQIKRLAAAMKKAGATHELAVVTGMRHSVVNDVKVLGRIYDFLDQHLKPATKSARE
jgi:dienelactone hydrolase